MLIEYYGAIDLTLCHPHPHARWRYSSLYRINDLHNHHPFFLAIALLPIDLLPALFSSFIRNIARMQTLDTNPDINFAVSPSLAKFQDYAQFSALNVLRLATNVSDIVSEQREPH